MGDADGGARSRARGVRALHRVPDAPAVARRALRRPTRVAARGSLRTLCCESSTAARGAGAQGAAAAAGAADESLPPFLEVSPSGGVAAAYRKLWDHYRDKDGENTHAAWTAKEWLPTREEQDSNPDLSQLNLGIHFIRGTWSDDLPSDARVRMYDRLQARFSAQRRASRTPLCICCDRSSPARRQIGASATRCREPRCKDASVPTDRRDQRTAESCAVTDADGRRLSRCLCARAAAASHQSIHIKSIPPFQKAAGVENRPAPTAPPRATARDLYHRRTCRIEKKACPSRRSDNEACARAT